MYMKGSAPIVIIVVLLAFFNIGLAMEPIESPVQYGQFCEAKKIAGKGLIDMSTSIEDGDISLSYSSAMTGDGEIDVDQVHEYSQKAEALRRRVESINKTADSNLNLYEKLKLIYSGTVPLVGEKSLTSAIGATIEEKFKVNEIEKDQTSFSSSTKSPSAEKITAYSPVHTVGIDTKSIFNGEWGTDATLKEMLSKNLTAHELFKGKFEVDKLVKFYESPVPEEETEEYCAGIDC